MDKPFLTFKEQLQRLQVKGISCESNEEKKMLIKKGYFNLVNGYKKPFVSRTLPDGTHIYYPETSVHKISQVFRFDRRLSSILLKNITHVEEEIRNISSYFFDYCNKDGGNWYSVSGYDPRVEPDLIEKLISDIKGEVESSKRSSNSYINHYASKDYEIPTWIMIKVIKMTTFTKFLDYSCKNVKIKICELFEMEYDSCNNDFKVLFGALNWMRKIRNACAHNERIMFIEDDNKAIITKYHKKLSNAYLKRRNKQIVDLLIFLKYVNTKRDYNKLIGTLTAELNQMRTVIGEVAFEKIRVGLGIRNIEHLQIISNEPKVINYLNLIY